MSLSRPCQTAPAGCPRRINISRKSLLSPIIANRFSSGVSLPHWSPVERDETPALGSVADCPFCSVDNILHTPAQHHIRRVQVSLQHELFSVQRFEFLEVAIPIGGISSGSMIVRSLSSASIFTSAVSGPHECTCDGIPYSLAQRRHLLNDRQAKLAEDRGRLEDQRTGTPVQIKSGFVSKDISVRNRFS